MLSFAHTTIPTGPLFALNISIQSLLHENYLREKKKTHNIAANLNIILFDGGFFLFLIAASSLPSSQPELTHRIIAMGKIGAKKMHAFVVQYLCTSILMNLNLM